MDLRTIINDIDIGQLATFLSVFNSNSKLYKQKIIVFNIFI